jgi:hypothetical protein
MAGLRLKNRVVMAGHGTRFVGHDTHHLTDQHIAYMADRARGGVGMMIQGATMIHPTGLATAGVSEVWSDESIPSYRKLANAVHEHGCAIFGQLSHLGRQGNTFASQREMWSPSPIADPASRQVPHAMTRREIRELIDAHRAAAVRFMTASFDGLEVYLAHGYLMCAFVSNYTNHRDDEYGGSLENRLRLPREALAAVRTEVGVGVPIGIRISADELVPGGLDVAQSREVVTRLLAESQVEYVSVSQSNYSSIEALIPDMSFPRRAFVANAAAIREVTAGVPVMTVARLITPEACNEILEKEEADFVCLVRPLIADPEFVRKIEDGRREELRECISCNVGCRGGPHRGLPISCLVNPAVGHEERWGIGKLGRVTSPRHVVVVGGGPAGLKAAEIAALRGHRVTLLEQAGRLGGQVLVAASAMPYRDEFGNSTRHLAREIDRLGVDVRMEIRADADVVKALAPDSVIVATGARPGLPDVPGVEKRHVMTVQEALAGPVEGASVVVVDSGEADWKALTTAERLAEDGHQVRLVTPVTAGAEIDVISKTGLLRRLRTRGVTFLEYRSLVAVGDNHVVVREAFTGEEERLESVDAVVMSWFGIASDGLFHELDAAGLEAHLVGDCLAPRRAIDAIWDAFRVARAL